MRVKTVSDWPEAEYRAQIKKEYRRIQESLDGFDPDLIEAEDTQGALTLSFSDRTRVILSAQPSVRQLWVALASQGTAVHLNYCEAPAGAWQWLDDKTHSTELYALLSRVLSEKLGQSVVLRGTA